ncbi:MAG: hypothetical protein EON60_03055 [Alphaproteobacteria bacterium]|nr:MAG: hypothetical protein EON60_03055 [Alphaproteobacteria bacterium]
MPLTILSRRNITFREPGKGEVTLLVVPGRDQIQIVKDLAGLNNTQALATTAQPGAKASAAKKQVQLSRVHIGRRFIYGTLPQEISNLRQPVKVWLAEDYAPLNAQAFFYIISPTVVIHGVREQDDEGYQNWRTAQLSLDETDPLKSIINAISDYALANPTEGLTVAVFNKLDLYERLQAELVTYNISPIPFSKLKPQPNLKPLYKHRDYTIMYLTFALFGIITLMASAGYLIITYLTLGELKREVESIQNEINSIKFNQNIGKISEPQQVLQTMARSINQQPSAMLHATAEAAANFGALNNVRAIFDSSLAEAPQNVGEGQLMTLVRIEKMNDELLLQQEYKALDVLSSRPWIREIQRSGAVGDAGDLAFILQIDQAPSSTVPMPGEISDFQPNLDDLPEQPNSMGDNPEVPQGETPLLSPPPVADAPAVTSPSTEEGSAQ